MQSLIKSKFFQVIRDGLLNVYQPSKLVRCFLSSDNVPLDPKDSKQIDPIQEKPKKNKKIIVLKDPDNFIGGKKDYIDPNDLIVGPDGIPYDPSKDPHYSNSYMMYKYPQYFTNNIGFKRAINVVKEDMSILKKKRIHKIREELGSPNHVDICIFGGGIIGSAIAYYIKEKTPFGLKIAVIEKDPTYIRSSTALSTGGLRQQFSIEENILMSLYSADFIRNARKHLSILDGEPPDLNYHPQGFLTLVDESKAEELIENHHQQIELGCLVEIYTANRIKEKFPMINTDGIVLGSYGLQNEGWFDPYALLVAFKAKAQFLGAEFVHAEVIDFNLKDNFHFDQISCNHVIIREPDGNVKQIEFSQAIIATGYNSGQIAKLLGYGADVKDWRCVVNFPIEPRKRYVYAFNSKDAPGINFPFLIDTTSTYCRREGLGGNFICGRSPSSDEEPEVDNLDVDYSYFEKLIEPAIKHRIPSFNSIKLKGAWAGFYDYNRIDQNPIIGRDPFFHNFYWATGFGGHGIQMSPAIGRAMMELILYNEFKTIDLRKFGWERLFNNKPLKEAYQY